MRIVATVFALVVTLGACGLVPPKPKAMYSGAVRAGGELATISEGSRGWLYVLQIDGQHVFNPTVGGAPFTAGLQVLPGHHDVRVKYANVDSFSMGYNGEVVTAKSEATVALDTKAGHTYVLQGRRLQGQYEFWFIDMGTGYDLNCLAPQQYAARFLRNEKVPGC